MGKKSAVLYELRGLAHAAPRRLPRRDPGFRPGAGDPPRRRPIAGSAAAGRTWSSTLPNWPWPTSKRRSSSIRPMAMPTTAAARPTRGCGDHRAAVADAREALRLGRTNPRVTYNAARIYAVAASVAAAEVGEKGRQARQLVVRVPGHRRAIDPRGVRTRSARETRGVLAGDGPARPGLEGDPAAAQVRRFDRHQQVAELVSDWIRSRRVIHRGIHYHVPPQVDPSRPEDCPEPARERSFGPLFLVVGHDVARRPSPAVCGPATRPPRALVLPASVMNSAVPITIGSAVPGNLATGGADFYEIEPSSDGRLIAQTQAAVGSPRAPALVVRRPGQPARSERRPVVRPARPLDRSARRRRGPTSSRSRASPAREPTRFRRH